MELLRKDTNVDFMGKRRLALMFSVALIVIGVASLAVRGLNFGIDFTGGTLVEVAYQEAVDVGEVRATLDQAGLGDALVQYFGTARDIAPIPLPIKWGMPNMGGPIATATGPVFIGASPDDYLRAYDVETGQVLWETRLARSAEGFPISYAVDGVQYVALPTGQGGGSPWRIPTFLGTEMVQPAGSGHNALYVFRIQ